jgi:hypothetical protein
MNRFQFLKQHANGYKLFWLMAVFLCLSACATDLRQQVNHNIVIKNTGKNRIFDVYVDYGHPYRIEDKMIPPGAQTTENSEIPIPALMRVNWLTSDKRKIEINVELKKNLEYATKLRAVELWISDDKLEVYQATPRGSQEEFTDRKRIYPR